MEGIFPDFEEFGVSASLRPLIFLENPSIFMDLDTSGARAMGVQAAGSMGTRGSPDFKNAVRTRKVVETRKSLPFLESGSSKPYKSGVASKTSRNSIFRLFRPRAIFGRAGPGPSEPGTARASPRRDSREISGLFLKEIGRNIPGFERIRSLGKPPAFEFS